MPFASAILREASVLLVLLAVSIPARAQTTRPLDLIERVYDIRDLIRHPVDFQLTSNTTAKSAIAQSPTTQLSAEQVAAKLIRGLELSVDPESWADLNGGKATISQTGDLLLVKQTAANLDLIAAMIDRMRRDSLTQITVQLRIINTGGAAVTGNGKWLGAGDLQRWSEFLDDAQVKGLLDAVENDRRSSTLTAPRLTLFNHQKAIVAIETETAYVQDVTKISDGQGNVAFDPTVGIFHSGVKFECKASVASEQSDTVHMDINASQNYLIDLEQVLAPGSDATHIAFIQIPHAIGALLKSTKDVPDGKTALFAVTPTSQPVTAPAPALKPMLFLITCKINKVEGP